MDTLYKCRRAAYSYVWFPSICIVHASVAAFQIACALFGIEYTHEGSSAKKKKKNRHENSKQVYKRHIEWLQSLYGTSDVLF